MRKIRCLAIALLLVFVFSTCALAVEGITINYAGVRESGTLEVIASSGYASREDLNFTASTENGDLVVSNAVALRDEGTSWFVILEYGSDNMNEHLRRASDEIMKGISNLVLDIDDGALIPCASDAPINVQKAQPLRDTLNGVHGTTDYKLVPSTLSSVMKYIVDNRSRLMPNVAVVLITQARLFSDTELASLRDTMNTYRNITTHVVCPLPKSAGNDWKDKALQVAQMGAGTLSGSGYILKDHSTAEATRAVDNIRDLERSMLLLLLEPKVYNVNSIGKELTLTQTTSGGKHLTYTGTLNDETFERWKEKIEEHNNSGKEDEEEPESGLMQVSLFSGGSSSTIWPGPEVEVPKDDLPLELIIGIALGVVILALVIVLLVIRNNRNKKKTNAVTYTAASGGSGSAKSGTQVMLRGEDGSSHTGTMRNNRLIIGRDSRKGAMLAIPNDGKLSGAHVLLEKQGNQLMVTDQNSMNGTKVNGVKITGPMLMKQNDTLTIGSHTYTVTWRG